MPSESQISMHRMEMTHLIHYGTRTLNEVIFVKMSGT